MACISCLILRNISCMGKNMIACVLRVYKHVLDWLLLLTLICWLLWIFFLPPSFQHLTKLFIFPAKFRWICSLSTTALMSGNAVCLSLLKPWEMNREEDLSSWREFKEILYKRCGFSWGISFIIHMMVHWEIKENGIDVVDLSIGSDLKLASVIWLN